MNDLEQARAEINKVDLEMAKLFERRMKACETIAAFKKENALSIRDKVREHDWIVNSQGRIESSEIESYYVPFLKNVVDLSCQYQARLLLDRRVAFCGVEGAFAHMAAKKMFPEAQHIPQPDFVTAYKSVENGENDCVVLPLENSYEGEVSTVMDLLFSGNLYVNQAAELPIRHVLLASQDANVDDIKTVVSHPQALGQCQAYIARYGFKTQPYSNTAVAAKYVKELNDPTVAAIASEEAANLFDLKMLAAGINDASNNSTRFAALSRVQNIPSSSKLREDENFILVFTVQNRAGALAQTLNIIGSHGYNMRSLRSRPMKDLQWSYFFYVEAEGNIHGSNGKEMIRELSAICARLKLVGTYYAGGK
ncbi:MAG: prephenate dehydratase domain-containing protein [Thermoguttaceae bacterium]|nr:prephenate dehydratase domain-containing protein [Thermoguttaceae bacterium]